MEKRKGICKAWKGGLIMRQRGTDGLTNLNIRMNNQ
jgi:hypothetical protein